MLVWAFGIVFVCMEMLCKKEAAVDRLFTFCKQRGKMYPFKKKLYTCGQASQLSLHGLRTTSTVCLQRIAFSFYLRLSHLGIRVLVQHVLWQMMCSVKLCLYLNSGLVEVNIIEFLFTSVQFSLQSVHPGRSFPQWVYLVPVHSDRSSLIRQQLVLNPIKLS